MSEKTCVACDGALDETAVQAAIGGRVVEACREECAEKLCEASAKGGH